MTYSWHSLRLARRIESWLHTLLHPAGTLEQIHSHSPLKIGFLNSFPGQHFTEHGRYRAIADSTVIRTSSHLFVKVTNLVKRFQYVPHAHECGPLPVYVSKQLVAWHRALDIQIGIRTLSGGTA